MISLLLLAATSCGTPQVFTPTSKLAKSPCEDELGSSYDDFKKEVEAVIQADGAVVKAVRKQIDDAATAQDKKATDLPIEIYVVTAAEYKQEVKTDKRAELAGKFDRFSAYTYATNTEPKTIKIKFFCKRSLREHIDRAGERHGARLIVHELVHAKYILMTQAGLKPAFNEEDKEPPADHPEDHNEGFSAEVDKLLKLVP